MSRAPSFTIWLTEQGVRRTGNPPHAAGRPSRADASAGLAACRSNSAQTSVTHETISALLLASRFRSILMLSCKAGKVMTAMGAGL